MPDEWETRVTDEDTWVAEADRAAPSPLAPGRALPQVDLRSSLTGRVAETMFWAGRNLERSEAVIRLVHAANRFLDQSPELVLEAGGGGLGVAGVVALFRGHLGQCARSLQFTGTPSWVAGDEIIQGLVPVERLAEAIAG